MAIVHAIPRRFSKCRLRAGRRQPCSADFSILSLQRLTSKDVVGPQLVTKPTKAIIRSRFPAHGLSVSI
jgi:hypothetical protein